MKIIISEALFEKAQQTRQEIVDLFQKDNEFPSFAEERKALADAVAGRVHVSVGTENINGRVEINISDRLVGVVLDLIHLYAKTVYRVACVLNDVLPSFTNHVGRLREMFNERFS